uniref:Uncharacterized protein n=1 Tax=Chenopodium quinoa TaxID=63459 RepID=A0A803LML8_CHEQI
MDLNGEESKTKPLISSLKPEKEATEGVEEDDDESKRLLSPRNGEIANGDSKIKKVQWNDTNGGNKLAEIVEFQPSDVSDSDDDEDSDSCFCTIM